MMSVTAPRILSYPAVARMAPAGAGLCPHGSSPGGCPVCSGMGGGGGGGGARKTAGLMNWNEAWAVWNALQVAKFRNEDYLKGLTILQLRNANQQQQAAQGATSNWNALLSTLGRYAPALAAFLSSPPPAFAAIARGLGQLTSGLQALASGMRQALAQGLMPFFNIGDKLATILGDARKLLDDILHHNVEQLKALMSRLRLDLLFSHIDGLLKQVMRQFAPRQTFRILNRRIESVLRKIKGLFGEEEEESSDED